MRCVGITIIISNGPLLKSRPKCYAAAVAITAAAAAAAAATAAAGGVYVLTSRL